MGIHVLIKNGHVQDPATGLDAITDIAIDGGVITAIGDVHGDAYQVIDAAGKDVVPGLVDIHAHLAPFGSVGTPVEAGCWPYGVTAIADAGGAGAATYEALRGQVLNRGATVRIFLYVTKDGLRSVPEDIDPAHFTEKELAYLLRVCPEVVGLKIRLCRECARDMGLAPYQAAAELAARLHTKLMVHCANAHGTMTELLNIAGEGHILSHVYHGAANTLTQEDIPALIAAKARGAILDLSEDHGGHLSFRALRMAMEAGCGPDTISTDLSLPSLQKDLCGIPTSMNATMSRMLAMGMDWRAVLRASTSTPARVLGLENSCGSIQVGRQADIAILTRLPYGKDTTDMLGELLPVPERVVCTATIWKGEIVYRNPLLE